MTPDRPTDDIGQELVLSGGSAALGLLLGIRPRRGSAGTGGTCARPRRRAARSVDPSTRPARRASTGETCLSLVCVARGMTRISPNLPDPAPPTAMGAVIP